MYIWYDQNAFFKLRYLRLKKSVFVIFNNIGFFNLPKYTDYNLLDN